MLILHTANLALEGWRAGGLELEDGRTRIRLKKYAGCCGLFGCPLNEGQPAAAANASESTTGRLVTYRRFVLQASINLDNH